MLKGIGINPDDIPLTDIGKMQLLGRLRKKFGPDIHANPQAVSAFELFNKHISKDATKARNMMNESLSAARRTLSALFGGKDV